ncbi:arsenate reductase (glutaredoxin) [Rhizobium sp. PP-WC-2G-219]|nr:arsenate reductase (glutaredoxin) [Rhizobium sp. PP-WC-2G-219]
MDVPIYHNPACGTSRNPLALIRHAGIEPTVIDYVKALPTRDQLVKMIGDAGLTVRQAIREKARRTRNSGSMIPTVPMSSCSTQC